MKVARLVEYSDSDICYGIISFNSKYSIEDVQKAINHVKEYMNDEWSVDELIPLLPTNMNVCLYNDEVITI